MITGAAIRRMPLPNVGYQNQRVAVYPVAAALGFAEVARSSG
jgi:hypothetical protein